ncbi:MAG: hypothetical protein ACR2FF_10270 [Mycobacteriales bacterium]
MEYDRAVRAAGALVEGSALTPAASTAKLVRTELAGASRTDAVTDRAYTEAGNQIGQRGLPRL